MASKPRAGTAAKPEAAGLSRPRLTLPAMEAFSTTLRTLVINVAVLLGLLLVVPVIVSQFWRNQVLIEPISVPPNLAMTGLTPEVAANRLWDGLERVKAESRTQKAGITAVPNSQRVDFSIPDSGLSIDSLIFHIRQFFNAYETKIGGEFRCADAACSPEGISLRLRIARQDVDIVQLPAMGAIGEDDYFREAASGVLEVLDPFIAIAADVETQPANAIVLARRLIRSHHPDAKWAHNLVGNIHINGQDFPAAIAEYQAALAIDPDFLAARTNLGDALRLSGDRDGARAAYREAQRRDKDDIHAYEGMADLLAEEGKPQEAVAQLQLAADAAPLDPRFYAKAGAVQFKAGDLAASKTLLHKALEIDPGYTEALAVLAGLYLIEQDYVSAERLYRDAADYAPDDAQAQGEHARILLITQDYDGAVARSDKAIALAPAEPLHRLRRAQALALLQRHDDAVEELLRARKLAPEDSEILYALGMSYAALDRPSEALAAYRTFLALAPEGMEADIVARLIPGLEEQSAAQASKG